MPLENAVAPMLYDPNNVPPEDEITEIPSDIETVMDPDAIQEAWDIPDDYMTPVDVSPPSHQKAKFVRYNKDGSALFDNGVSVLKDGSIAWEDEDTGVKFAQKNPYVKAVRIGVKRKSEPSLEDRAARAAADKGLIPKKDMTPEERAEYEKTRLQLLNPKLPVAGTGTAYADEKGRRILQSVDELEKKVTWRTTGLGSLADVMPASDARDFKAELDTLKANIAFGELTEMRNASKTGGALGQVSNIELGLLESTLGALDTRQSSDNFRKQLAKVRGSIQRWNEAKAAASSKSETPSATPQPCL